MPPAFCLSAPRQEPVSPSTTNTNPIANCRVIGSLPKRFMAGNFSLLVEKAGARPCRRVFPDGLRQRHHAAPELVLAAPVHIVLANEVKLAIRTDSINRKARGKHLDGGAVAYRERHLARSAQHMSGPIEPEPAQRHAATVDVPNEGRLAGRLVD